MEVIAIYIEGGQFEGDRLEGNRLEGDQFEDEQLHQSAAVTVMDARTGFVIYENAQHDLMYPASITKIMTALLVIEEVENLQEEMIFSEHAVLSLPEYASRMNAYPGDVITIYEALYGLMLPSGNDVANALAEHVSGNIPTFVTRMNQRAAELGAHNTRFVNPCGLPGDGQHTTAYDMALIMQEAISHPVFIDLIAAPAFNIRPMENFPEGLPIFNTNRLIRRDGDFFDARIVGGKTGFTNAAQHTLVSYANHNGQELIISTLYAPRLATFTDTTALLDYVFEFPQEVIFDHGSFRWELPVMQVIEYESEMISTITAQGDGDLTILMPLDMPEVRYELVVPDYLTPPVRVGDVIGHKDFYAGDIFLGRVEIISANSALPRVITISRPPENTPFLESATQTFREIAPFFAMLLVVTVLVFGTLLVLLRRHRRIMRRRMIRRRRKMARVTQSQMQYRPPANF